MCLIYRNREASEHPDVVPIVARSVWRAMTVWSAAMLFSLWLPPRGPRCARRVGAAPLLSSLAWRRNSLNQVDYALEARFHLPIRLDGTTSEPTLGGSFGPTQSAPPALTAERRSDLPLHNALRSTALGDALDGEKSDPKLIVRELHVNWDLPFLSSPNGRWRKRMEGVTG